jgi:hypothetical protein
VSLEEYRAEARKPLYVAAMENQLRRCLVYGRNFDTFKVAVLMDVLTPEYEFQPHRKWRLDYALIAAQVGLEMEGLVRGEGHGTGASRHTTNAGYTNDCVKYSTAASMGWLVVRATQDMVKSGIAIRLFLDTLAMRGLRTDYAGGY